MNKSNNIRIARFLNGEMSVQEEIAYRKEIESNPAQQSELKNMEKTWKYFDKATSESNSDSGKAWNLLKKRLEDDGLLENPESVPGIRKVARPLKLAASFLLIMAIGIPSLYYGIIRNGNDESVLNQFSDKGVSTVDLPDGSRVYLNEGARIEYPAEFGQERSVKLNGEAFFEVMSDPVNPFNVRSGNVVVSVLGTSFNVKTTKNVKDVEVFVESGNVRMTLEDSEKSIILEPGELGYTKESELKLLAQSDPNYISWKTKDFKFVDANLMEVLRELEESYHVEINTGSLDLEDMKITTTYREQSIEAILETIGAAFGLTVNFRDDGYYLTD